MTIGAFKHCQYHNLENALYPLKYIRITSMYSGTFSKLLTPTLDLVQVFKLLQHVQRPFKTVGFVLFAFRSPVMFRI